jgi:hypothetical protein
MSNKSLSTVGRSKSKGSSAAVRRGDNMGEVIIDGVVFVFDETGTKLVKKAQQQPGSDSASTDAGAAAATGSTGPGEQTSEGPDGASKAPLRTSVNGQAFVRTKRGNLISAELLEKRKAQKESTAKLKRMAALGRQIGDNERIRCVYDGRVRRKCAILKLLSTSYAADRRERSLATRRSASRIRARKAFVASSPRQVRTLAIAACPIQEECSAFPLSGADVSPDSYI